jgi:DNA (cytosine-5)-methyltransferase 1/DNA (cytosine-5)-methyltransferase 3A
MNKEVEVVMSICDGMSGTQVALNNMGIKPKRYLASEVDPYAISVTQHNFPDTEQLGDMKAWRTWDIDWATVDLLVAGFPCQAWSIAGYQAGVDDPRGALVFDLVDIFEHAKQANPDIKFLFENVKMKRENMIFLSTLFGQSPIEINSALVSAQNRVRYYWTNLEVTQPKDRGILLSSILDDKEAWFVDRDKSYCLDANYWKGGNLKSYFEKCRRQLVFSKDGLAHVGEADLNGHDSIKRVYAVDGKAPTLTTMSGGHREPKIALNEQRYRKLTPSECARLQTIDPSYLDVPKLSNTQKYKMLGNGFNVATIEHIFSALK